MRKLTAGVWAGLYLCCAWTASVGAAGPDPQVIVEGSRNAGETVRASGHDVPLLHALEQIVPVNYSVNVPNAGAWADIPVSWHGKEPFVHALSEILASNRSLQARVNTDLNLVTVTAVATAPTQASPIAGPVETPAVPPLAGTPGAVIPVAAAAVNPAAAAAQTKAAANEPSPVEQTSLPNPPQLLAAAPAPALPRADSQLPKGAPLTLTVPAPAAPVAAPAPTAPAAAPAPAAPAAVPALAASASADSAPGLTVWVLHPSDGSVRNALARWARDADWQFIWAVPTDFSIDASATIHGSFEDALHSVVDALSHSQVPIQVIMYKGNRVLRVTAKGAG
jgi:hypothetical protein